MSYRSISKSLSAAAWLFLFALPATAQRFVFSVDVPVELVRVDYLANQTVQHDAGGYAVRFDGPTWQLDEQVNINALFALSDSAFLFSTDASFSADGSTYEACDVVLFDGADYSPYLRCADLRLPEGADIDSLSSDAQGRLLLSFDEPTPVGAQTFDANDVARVEGGVSLILHLDGESVGLPADSNVVGYDVSGAVQYFAFDAPVDLAGLTFLPGQIARLDTGSWDIFFSDSSFPSYAATTDFSLGASAGEIETVLADKIGSEIVLAWTGGCGSAQDYAVYEGTLGDWSGHVPVHCTTSGATADVVTPGAGDRFYLVVPLNGESEGGYGSDSAGNPRPASGSACLAEQRMAICL